MITNVAVAMEAVAIAVTTMMEATPAHATVDIPAVASMDVWVSLLLFM